MEMTKLPAWVWSRLLRVYDYTRDAHFCGTYRWDEFMYEQASYEFEYLEARDENHYAP